MRRALPTAFKTWRRASQLERLASERAGLVLSRIYHHEKATLHAGSGIRDTAASARRTLSTDGGPENRHVLDAHRGCRRHHVRRSHLGIL